MMAPMIAMIHIQKSAPGPPVESAIAVPAIFPVPKLPPSTDDKAEKADMPRLDCVCLLDSMIDSDCFRCVNCSHLNRWDSNRPSTDTRGMTK